MGSREAKNLTRKQHLILIGKILGDGTLEKNGNNTRFRVAQCQKQKEYVFWLYKNFKNLVTKKPRYLKVTSRYGKVGQFRFDTYSLHIFNRYRELFYPNGRKVVPQSISDFLDDPLSLAVWYMDDGYKRTDNSGLYLCTSGFNKSENRLLQECLFTNFGVGTNIHYAGGYARLHIPSKNMWKFCDYIRPYIIPSMCYKLL